MRKAPLTLWMNFLPIEEVKKLAIIDKSGFYRDGELKFFSGSYAEKDKVFPGEMLVACTDLTRNADIIGTPIWVPNECDFYLYTMDLAKLTPKPNIDKKFLYYALKTKKTAQKSAKTFMLFSQII